MLAQLREVSGRIASYARRRPLRDPRASPPPGSAAAPHCAINCGAEPRLDPIRLLIKSRRQVSRLSGPTSGTPRRHISAGRGGLSRSASRPFHATRHSACRGAPRFRAAAPAWMRASRRPRSSERDGRMSLVQLRRRGLLLPVAKEACSHDRVVRSTVVRSRPLVVSAERTAIPRGAGRSGSAAEDFAHRSETIRDCDFLSGAACRFVSGFRSKRAESGPKA
jgi:hypothetical protein